MYPLDIRTVKTAGFRIRVEPELRQAFVVACQANEQSAAQVLRLFMRHYVGESGEGKQGELFVAQEGARYELRKSAVTNKQEKKGRAA